LDSSLAPVLFDLISRETSPEAAKLELSTLSSITFNMPFDPKIAKLLPQALGSSSIDVIAEATSLLDRYESKLAGSKGDKAVLKDNCSLAPPVDEAIKNALGRDWPSKDEEDTRKVLADLYVERSQGPSINIQIADHRAGGRRDEVGLRAVVR
jgi:hypothetical protein